jgi:phage terminase large subunit GpA-like protein
MSDQITTDHLERLTTAVLKRYTVAMMSKWVSENTYLGGLPYSYEGHEYQETILSDTSVEVNVRKCSQVGVSEASARLALAAVSMLSPFTVAYTLPTAKFAGTFMKTRIDPIIDGSRLLKAAVHKTTDNNEIKRFGDSYLYMRGAASSNAPISIPVDMLIHDEYDFCDQEVLTQYISRLTHSKWKMIKRFSTPTLPDFGIDKAFQESRRHFNLCKCEHCNHWFQPDYYTHLVIPGYTGELRGINKQTLTRIRWQEAYLACPNCGKSPSLMPEHREYVCENPDENYVAAGYQVSPFDAPTIITPSYLVKTSTLYERQQDFQNFALGLPAEDSEATLMRADFDKIFKAVAESRGLSYVMGVDVGNTYHFVVMGVDVYGKMVVVHTEQVPMGKARERYHQLRMQWHVECTVIDSGPHAETVMALQNEDDNLFAAVYIRSKSILTHTVLDREEEEDEGKAFVRQVNVNRSRALDAYMLTIREQHIEMLDCEDKELVISHHCSMKRVKNFDNESGELVFTWQKTDGQDHYHHAHLYAWVAARIRGVGRTTIAIPTTMVHAFRLKQK